MTKHEQTNYDAKVHSDAERIKIESEHLRGDIAGGLVEELQLLISTKFLQKLLKITQIVVCV